MAHQGSPEIRMEGRSIGILEKDKHEITEMANLCTKFTLPGCHRFYPELPDHWYDIVEAPVRVPKLTSRKKHNREYRSRHGHVIIGFHGADEDGEQLFEDNGVDAEEQLFENNGVEAEEQLFEDNGVDAEEQLFEDNGIAVNEVEEVAIDGDVPELGIEHQAEEEQVENDVEAIVQNEVAPIDGGDVPEEFTEYEGGLLAAKLGGGNDNKAVL